MKLGTTKVFEINGNLIVAESAEIAIKIFREKYPFPNDVEEVTKVYGKNGCLAIIEIS